MTTYAKRDLIWKEDSIKERRVLEKELASQGVITTARRMLSIDQMGIWNSDQPIPPLPLVIHKLKFYTSDEEELEFNYVCIVDQSLNTVFSYNLAYTKGIRFDLTHKNFLYAVKDEKKLYISDSESFKNFNFGSKEMSFKMKELQKLEDIEAALEKIKG